MEMHRTAQYRTYMKLLKWDVDQVDQEYVYSKHIPITGRIAKLQRWQTLPEGRKLIAFLKEKKVNTVAFEPDITLSQDQVTDYANTIKKAGFRLNKSPFLGTKTIHISLVSSESSIFSSFSEAKRRAVRRAQKNNVSVEASTDIELLIKTKNQSAGMFGFITTHGIKELWKAFAPNAHCVLAYEMNNVTPIGGILLIYSEHIAYYWIAGASHKGKKLFAPTLLVWEAIKLSKIAGNHTFDFVGIWDERFPNENKDWLGFSKFKQGFNGTNIYYPVAR